jgi:PAS domain S-box-containing protein
MLTFAAAAASLARGPALDANQLWVLGILALLVGATWVSPLVLYRDGQSEAQNLDEGFFVAAALLLPLGAVVMVFAVAVAVAQAVRRRKLVKSVFNWGQVVTAAGAGSAVSHFLAPPTAHLTGPQLLAALAGAMVFAVINGLAVAGIVASLGTSWRRTLDGMEIRLLLLGSCIAIGLVGSLAVSEYRWALPLAVLPLLILRQVLAGHFQARRDRTRLLGLLDAALEANRSLSEGVVLDTILSSARSLLGCNEASVRVEPAGPAELGAAMLVNGEACSLVVSGRLRTEPFEKADVTLLETLAAVGAGALTNGRNYREARFQRERLAAITSSLGEGVCALDRNGVVTFVNPAAAEMLGWAVGDESSRPPTPDFVLGPARRVIETGETVRCDDAEFVGADGLVVPVAFTASSILDDDQVAGVVIAFRDISERREVELAIRTARDQAIEASRLKSRFLANMSHEIRTPMNGVLGMSKLLLETDIDEAQRNYLLTIRDSGENLMVILNDILDFSKIEAGKMDLEDVEFDLSAALTSVINSMGVAAHNRSLALHSATDPSLPRMVRGDPVRFRQVLTNLVSNAVKFTEVGAVTVSARMPEPGLVRVSVSDTGIGIDPSARATVLDPFGQADSSTTRRYGGTGLGLAICCQLVAMMGGRLDFVSQPGVGSTFWFEVPLPVVSDCESEVRPAELPLRPAQEPVRAPAVIEPPAAPRSPRSQLSQPTAAAGHADEPKEPVIAANRPRVLVADDNAVNQLVASLRLEKMGYQVDVARTGKEAVLAVQRVSYLAVLMDGRMPVMDGYEATRRIRSLEGPAAGTFIIAMTSSAMAGDREECILSGMDDYLAKPLDADLLAEALARAGESAARGGRPASARLLLDA